MEQPGAGGDVLNPGMFTGRDGDADGHGHDSQHRSPALLSVPGCSRDRHRLDGAFSLHGRGNWCLKQAATLLSCQGYTGN